MKTLEKILNWGAALAIFLLLDWGMYLIYNESVSESSSTITAIINFSSLFMCEVICISLVVIATIKHGNIFTYIFKKGSWRK